VSAPQVRLGVVIPLANEQETVDEVLRRVSVQLDPADRIFCVLDHASRDATLQIVEAASHRDCRIRLVWAPENTHVVDAYFRGYREALQAKCRWILEMDGGLSHLPEEIPRFVAAMETGVDFAAGSRFMAGGSYQGRLSRLLLSRGGTYLSKLFLGTRMKDSTSGYECFTHRALSYVVDQGVMSTGHFFQTEIRSMLRDWRWVEVPITYQSPSRSVGIATILESLCCLWSLFKKSKRCARVTVSS
jgi:dolichol-phosphate mannosyltransferase